MKEFSRFLDEGKSIQKRALNFKKDIEAQNQSNFVIRKIKRDWDVKNAVVLPIKIFSENIDFDSLNIPFRVLDGTFINNYKEQINIEKIITPDIIKELEIESIIPEIGCIIFISNNNDIYCAIGKDKAHGGGFNNLRKLVGQRVVVNGFGRNDESIDINSILESEYPSTGQYTIGKLIKELWNVNSDYDVTTICNDEVFYIYDIDASIENCNEDEEYVINLFANKGVCEANLNVGKLINLLKQFDANEPVSVMCFADLSVKCNMPIKNIDVHDISKSVVLE